MKSSVTITSCNPLGKTVGTRSQKRSPDQAYIIYRIVPENPDQ